MRSSLCRRSCARNHARMFYAMFFCLHCHVIDRHSPQSQHPPPGARGRASGNDQAERAGDQVRR